MTLMSMTLAPEAATEEPEMAFGEPWQAEAFATALQLSQNGVYSWSEWVEAFATTIREQPQQPGESLGEAYYRQWLTTLEMMLQHKALVSEQDVEDRQALWHLAYLHTPHGQPVQLDRVAHIIDPCSTLKGVQDGHDHHHHHHHHGHLHGIPTPITIVPGSR